MKEEFDVKKEYNKFKDKYDLPNLDELNNIFELDVIEKKDFLLRNIRRRMIDKLNFCSKIIESVIYPNLSSLVEIHDTKFFNEDEKNKLSKIYEKIIVYEKRSLVLDNSTTEKEDSLFIKNLFKEWDIIKKDVEEVLRKIEKCWTKKEEKPEGNAYFG